MAEHRAARDCAWIWPEIGLSGQGLHVRALLPYALQYGEKVFCSSYSSIASNQRPNVPQTAHVVRRTIAPTGSTPQSLHIVIKRPYLKSPNNPFPIPSPPLTPQCAGAIGPLSLPTSSKLATPPSLANSCGTFSLKFTAKKLLGNLTVWNFALSVAKTSSHCP